MEEIINELAERYAQARGFVDRVAAISIADSVVQKILANGTEEEKRELSSIMQDKNIYQVIKSRIK